MSDFNAILEAYNQEVRDAKRREEEAVQQQAPATIAPTLPEIPQAQFMQYLTAFLKAAPGVLPVPDCPLTAMAFITKYLEFCHTTGVPYFKDDGTITVKPMPASADTTTACAPGTPQKPALPLPATTPDTNRQALLTGVVPAQGTKRPTEEPLTAPAAKRVGTIGKITIDPKPGPFSNFAQQTPK